MELPREGDFVKDPFLEGEELEELELRGVLRDLMGTKLFTMYSNSVFFNSPFLLLLEQKGKEEETLPMCLEDEISDVMSLRQTEESLLPPLGIWQWALSWW